MDKCPKCGAGEDASESAFACGTRRGVNATVKVSNRCLRRQLAAANERANEAENTIERIREAWLPEVLRSVETTVDVRMECDDFNTITRALDGGA